MNNITVHGELTVRGQSVTIHLGGSEHYATVNGVRFNVHSLWQLYQLLRLIA
ncbi:hypothetical protein [Bifidobacterium oedipodis]|uniref:hypothetical protein n=1 Tax=Bifidobacterium oedipodis TaxID=2675322 RepID=UPI00145D1A32|nr:hypothetical protein [Bifidobacterium sp. DSM 109957]